MSVALAGPLTDLPSCTLCRLNEMTLIRLRLGEEEEPSTEPASLPTEQEEGMGLGAKKAVASSLSALDDAKFFGDVTEGIRTTVIGARRSSLGSCRESTIFRFGRGRGVSSAVEELPVVLAQPASFCTRAARLSVLVKS